MRRHLPVVLAALVLGSTLASGPWTSTPAAAAAPVQGPVFNDPTGSETQQMAIMTKIMKAIDGTKRGATIRMAFFSPPVPPFLRK